MVMLSRFHARHTAAARVPATPEQSAQVWAQMRAKICSAKDVD